MVLEVQTTDIVFVTYVTVCLWTLLVLSAVVAVI